MSVQNIYWTVRFIRGLDHLLFLSAGRGEKKRKDDSFGSCVIRKRQSSYVKVDESDNNSDAETAVLIGCLSTGDLPWWQQKWFNPRTLLPALCLCLIPHKPQAEWLLLILITCWKVGQEISCGCDRKKREWRERRGRAQRRRWDVNWSEGVWGCRGTLKARTRHTQQQWRRALNVQEEDTANHNGLLPGSCRCDAWVTTLCGGEKVKTSGGDGRKKKPIHTDTM